MPRKPSKPVKASLSADEALSDLLGTATPKAKGKPAKKNEVYLDGDPQFTTVVDDYAASAIIADIAAEQKKQDGTALKSLALERYIELWANSGAKPDNPLMRSQHANVRLQVKDLYTVSLPEDATLGADAVSQLLLDEDLDDEETEELVSCVKLVQNLATKPLDKLRNGSDAEKKVAEKVLRILAENLSREERALVLETKPALEVDAEALNAKINEFCENDPDKLRAVLSVFVPQLALSQVKHDNALQVATQRFGAAAAAQGNQPAE